ncbi:MAG: ubiquitin-specific protease doa4 [Cirrosporium novae-zelandiae]|nr:MAG: ubiquitin-specific protease doa4 [Cirrosporium novae-zelandiae]
MSVRASWTGPDPRANVSYNGINGAYGNNLSNQGGKAGRRYPSIKELTAQAYASTSLNINLPIRVLVRNAEEAKQRADSYVSFKRIDLAYVEHLIASEIVLNVIPVHKDYPDLSAGSGDAHYKYRDLIKSVQSQQSMFEEIKQMIIDDNETEVQPSFSSPSRQSMGSPHRSRRSIQTPYPDGSALPMPDGRPDSLSHGNENGQLYSVIERPSSQSDSRPSSSSGSPRMKPVISPKPKNLHGRLISLGDASTKPPPGSLVQRFARLRVAGSSDPGVGPHPTSPQTNGGRIEMPSAFDSRSSISSQTSGTYAPLPYGRDSSHRPIGPREMPITSSGPPPPPKIPLSSALPSLPRAPSPTYSPARNVSSIIPLEPDNHERNSSIMDGIDGRLPMKISRTSSSYGESGNGYNHNPMDRAMETRTPTPTPRIPEVSSGDGITVDTLYEYLRKYRILLIDVRSRQDFDTGHIFSSSIICVEPLDLRSGMSAEDLEERLIISPDNEQKLFERRNEYDLVVYYDEGTRSTDYLRGSPIDNDAPVLRAIYDTLYEFNYYKPLQRAPVMLLGGLEAWADLVGPQALATSQTAALIGSTQQRHSVARKGRPIGRVSMASQNSSLEVRRRRLREYKPLNADEERAWLEKAKGEGVAAPDYQRMSVDRDSIEEESYEEEPPSPFIHSYEDFLRRFPEPSSIQESMVMPSIPSVPPSAFESVPPLSHEPSRPPPALSRPSYSGVSERGQSYTVPLARQASASRPPLYSSASMLQRLKLPRTGLVNYGVTCYMNATIQCLNATVVLSKFFLDNRWVEFVQRNWKGSQGVMPQIYANLIRNLWQEDCQAIRPTTFRKFCGRLNREWGIDRQQDAKEFFDFLVDCLHEDLNVNWERTPLKPLSTKEELIRERMPMHVVSKNEWDRYSHREHSLISSLFAGQHASRLRCTTCNWTSTTYEAFYSISVEIPRSGVGDIYQCLNSYTKEEMLSGDEVWKCPNCKCEREAYKKITLTRAPEFLVVHFKRFSASKTEAARKVHTPIEFPLYGLNLGPFMLPPPTPEVAQRLEFLNGINKVDPATTAPFTYDAYAVMRHLGRSGNGGHYIALVKDGARGCWRKFDDDRYTDFDPHKLRPDQRLQNEEAYIVFYTRAPAR